MAAAFIYFASQVERRLIVEIVLVQMVVTAALLIGFTVEVLLGMTNDPQFGPMVTVGLGGIFTEVFADAVTFQPPIGAAGRLPSRVASHKPTAGVCSSQ